MAEAHPVGFRWVMKARERGAKVIHVDPRFGRTGASADLHVPIRPGTDIAFLGGLIRHVIENRRRFWQDVDDEGRPLRRATGFAHLGGATLDNEENYLIKKLFTALGAIQIENQARI